MNLFTELKIIIHNSKSKWILSNKNANGWKLQIVVERGVSFGGICMQN
jgi:hypothetical protein